MAEIPSQFTHSIKIEETAKGCRISVHVYANDMEAAIDGVITTYQLTKDMLKENKIPIAPMEVQNG